MQPALLEKQHASTQASAAHHNQFLQKLRRKTMSNINNQAQLYAFDAVQDLNNESAASVSGGDGPILGQDVTLYAHSNFRAPLVSTNRGTPYVGDDVNDRTTSIVVRLGKWRFYTDSNFRGVSADLEPGRYPNLVGLGILPNNSISSFHRVR